MQVSGQQPSGLINSWAPWLVKGKKFPNLIDATTNDLALGLKIRLFSSIDPVEVKAFGKPQMRILSKKGC